MSRFFTSDEHYGHIKIIEYSKRPFQCVEEMNEEMVRRHNAVVGPNDEVYHLGDFSLRDYYAEQYIKELHGKHHLIPGNHEPCHSCHHGFRRDLKRYAKFGFIMEPERLVMDLPFGRVLLCHMPLRLSAVPFDKDRYLEHRPEEGVLADDGCLYLLHGHVHEQWKRRGRMINVGVDQWDFTPVSIEELGRFIQATNPA